MENHPAPTKIIVKNNLQIADNDSLNREAAENNFELKKEAKIEQVTNKIEKPIRIQRFYGLFSLFRSSNLLQNIYNLPRILLGKFYSLIGF